MTYSSFRQIAYLLGGTYSASAMARLEGLQWPPPPTISLRSMLSYVLSLHMQVTSVPVAQLPAEIPRTTISQGYYDAPSALLDRGQPAPIDCTTPTSEGRVFWDLQVAARDRDGNAILKRVAGRYAENVVAPGSYSQDLLTAMTQLAVTGSSAFAAWSANPTQDLTSYLIGEGMSPAAAAAANQQIMSDFHAALQAVRNPGAGINESSLRQGLKYPWIAVSGEDDPPDFPINIAIAPYPQYHLAITVQGIPLSIRYIIASSQNQGTAPATPSIPPGDEVILYIHGEGSRAEEAVDFIPKLFEAGAAAGRSFTVIAFDQPSCGYSTMVPHLSVAQMPPTSGGAIDTSPFAGSPILDFVEKTIVTFVGTLMASLPNPITAVVGGSLGGHMALRLAAGQYDWVRNVVAWSPASVWEYDASISGVSVPHRMLSDPTLAGRATDGPTPPWPASPELPSSRQEFFTTVWCQDTFDPKSYAFDVVLAVAGALITEGIVGGITALGLATVLLGLTPIPPQPQMWYRDDWPSKPVYIEESRRDRRELYNTNFRQWHWRISEELIGYKFDTQARPIIKPLLLMVGENDDFPDVHYFSYVKNFAATLNGLGKALTVQDTGHSIHNERPTFLANQIIAFAPRP